MALVVRWCCCWAPPALSYVQPCASARPTPARAGMWCCRAPGSPLQPLQTRVGGCKAGWSAGSRLPVASLPRRRLAACIRLSSGPHRPPPPVSKSRLAPSAVCLVSSGLASHTRPNSCCIHSIMSRSASMHVHAMRMHAFCTDMRWGAPPRRGAVPLSPVP